MQLFFTPSIDGDSYTLTQEESRHCIKVLRKTEGDGIQLTDGKGTLFEGVLMDSNLKGCSVKINSRELVDPPRAYQIHIAIAPTKNMARFEWFVEKATEIGIDRITPILCAHSERDKLKRERVERIILGAAKQSVKFRFPVLDELIGFADFIQKAEVAQGFIAHCEETDRQELSMICRKQEDVLILIGPEGDFSKSEIALALKHQFKPVSLGQSRLRTETAGIVACHSIHLLNQF